MNFKELSGLKLPLISFSILIFCLAVLYLYQNPPKLNRLFTVKPGQFSFSAPESISLGQPFTLTVGLDTSNQKVNAVGVYLRFNPSQVRVLDIDTRKSFCQFYPEKKYDNNIGTISLSCGAPHPGVAGTNTLMELKIMPITVSSPTFLIDPNSKILLSNGKGTNIFSGQDPFTISIISDL